MKQKVGYSRFKALAWTVFLAYTLWWLYINVLLRVDDHASLHNELFTDTYGVMALVGGIIAVIASRKWGGRKSLIGRALLFFGIGLLLQEFGQIAYSYYYYVQEVDVPYPSLADIGYFGSVLAYIYAAWQLAKAAGIKFALRRRSKQILAIIIPIAILLTSYMFFLQDYVFDFSSTKSTIAVILDFGYPFWQAVYIAIALVTYLLSKNLLGGIMRSKILLVLFALCVQYAADFSFLYANQKGTFFAAGANDFLYFLAYSVMTFALISFLIDFNKLSAPEAAKAEEEA